MQQNLGNLIYYANNNFLHNLIEHIDNCDCFKIINRKSSKRNIIYHCLSYKKNKFITNTAMMPAISHLTGIKPRIKKNILYIPHPASISIIYTFIPARRYEMKILFIRIYMFLKKKLCTGVAKLIYKFLS